jgi:hypothetical protein
MVSILAIPEQNPSNAVSVELTPNQTREWLARLSLLDAEDSLSKMLEILHEFNRVTVKPGSRLRLLELYRTPIGFIGENIEKTLADKYCPLADEHSKIAELCRRVTIEMAYGYKSVVLDSAAMLRSSRSNNDLPTAIHRSIRYLTHVLYNSALCYNSYPAGTWMEIHTLYIYARKLGFLDNLVKDALNRPRPKNNIRHVYQQAVLFGISDSYKQPVNIMGMIYRYLDRWASSVEISPFRKLPATRCQFVIDPTQDRPAQTYAEGLTPKRSKHHMLLDARTITNIAHNQWHKLRAGTSPGAAGLGAGFFDDGGSDMLERVIQAWGLTPRRKHPRNAISGPYQLALGINACNFYLNGGFTFKGIADENSRRRPSAATDVGSLQQGQEREPAQDHVKQNWLGADESIHGICMYVDLSRPAAVLVRVGEVVAFRTNRGGANWSAGLIRWVRITETELRLGLQKLGAGCKAGAVRAVGKADIAGGGFKNSISIPKHENIEQSQSLLTPPGTYRNSRSLMVDEDDKAP